MSKEDSMIFRAIAELALTGYTDQYGNHKNLADEALRQWRPTEDFYKRLEKQIDTDKLAEAITKAMASVSSYDQSAFSKRIYEMAVKTASEKLAEEMLIKMKENNHD